jgi:hypothetical protein
MVYDALKAYFTVFYNYFVISKLLGSQHGSAYLATVVIYNNKLLIMMVPDSKALSFFFPQIKEIMKARSLKNIKIYFKRQIHFSELICCMMPL